MYWENAGHEVLAQYPFPPLWELKSVSNRLLAHEKCHFNVNCSVYRTSGVAFHNFMAISMQTLACVNSDYFAFQWHFGVPLYARAIRGSTYIKRSWSSFPRMAVITSSFALRDSRLGWGSWKQGLIDASKARPGLV